MQYLKSQGHGNRPNESDELIDNDIEKLFECGQLGVNTPLQVINLLHLSFSLVLGMRCGQEQRNLKWGDIELCTDDDGDQYLCHIKERQTKTRVGSDPKDVRKFKPKIWNHPEDKSRCTVEQYKIYKLHRPNDMNTSEAPFFLSINHMRNPNKPDQCWYKNCPLGKNQIYKIVQLMIANFEALNDGRKLTNHSIRKHLLQKCNDIGLAPTATVQISGHKNLQSVNSYSKLNENQQKQIATALINNKSSTGAVSHPTHSSKSAPQDPESPISHSQNILYKRQSAQSNLSTIFQGTTTITGGVFNFFSGDKRPSPEQIKNSPPKKYRRILNVIDSDSDYV